VLTFLDRGGQIVSDARVLCIIAACSVVGYIRYSITGSPLSAHFLTKSGRDPVTEGGAMISTALVLLIMRATA
jgi:hypothetical protein